jgi:hypothetical protein
MQYKDIELYGVSLTVCYVEHGRYMPATNLDPEEFPEIEIISICAQDSNIDLQNILDEKFVDSIVEDLYEC